MHVVPRCGAIVQPSSRMSLAWSGGTSSRSPSDAKLIDGSVAKEASRQAPVEVDANVIRRLNRQWFLGYLLHQRQARLDTHGHDHNLRTKRVNAPVQPASAQGDNTIARADEPCTTKVGGQAQSVQAHQIRHGGQRIPPASVFV